MPEFLLRYKVPSPIQKLEEIVAVQQQAEEMAKAIQSYLQQAFKMDVVWEIREFGLSSGMPNFYTVIQMTDNEAKHGEKVAQAQIDVQNLMKVMAFKDQTVGCWFQRVIGKWGEDRGFRYRT